MNQQNDKQITDYHPSPSKLTSRIRALIFMWTPKVLSLNNILYYFVLIFFEFFLKPL